MEYIPYKTGTYEFSVHMNFLYMCIHRDAVIDYHAYMHFFQPYHICGTLEDMHRRK